MQTKTKLQVYSKLGLVLASALMFLPTIAAAAAEVCPPEPPADCTAGNEVEVAVNCGDCTVYVRVGVFQCVETLAKQATF